MKAVENYQRDLLQQALRESSGNKTQAARKLLLKRTTLIEKCNRLGIDSDEFKGESERARSDSYPSRPESDIDRVTAADE